MPDKKVSLSSGGKVCVIDDAVYLRINHITVVKGAKKDEILLELQAPDPEWPYKEKMVATIRCPPLLAEKWLFEHFGLLADTILSAGVATWVK